MANAAPSTANRPLMRAALYARFSSDLQKQTSIEDQLVACRAFAARQASRLSAPSRTPAYPAPRSPTAPASWPWNAPPRAAHST